MTDRSRTGRVRRSVCSILNPPMPLTLIHSSSMSPRHSCSIASASCATTCWSGPRAGEDACDITLLRLFSGLGTGSGRNVLSHDVHMVMRMLAWASHTSFSRNAGATFSCCALILAQAPFGSHTPSTVTSLTQR